MWSEYTFTFVGLIAKVHNIFNFLPNFNWKSMMFCDVPPIWNGLNIIDINIMKIIIWMKSCWHIVYALPILPIFWIILPRNTRFIMSIHSVKISEIKQEIQSLHLFLIKLLISNKYENHCFTKSAEDVNTWGKFSFSPS